MKKLLELASHSIIVVSGSIKKLFSVDCVNVYHRFCPVEKFRVTLHCLYRDSLTLSLEKEDAKKSLVVYF